MSLIEKLKRPFSKRFGKVADKIRNFARPVKSAVQTLQGKLPSAKGFVGSEDLGEVPKKAGIGARLKQFKKSLHEMGDFQKLILLTIVICVPAGILISTMLVKALNRRP